MTTANTGMRPDDAKIIVSARTFIASRVGWLARPILSTEVVAHNGKGHGTDGRGNIYIDFDSVDLAPVGPDGVEREDNERAAMLASLLVVGVWRTLRRHDRRYEQIGKIGYREWDVAASAISLRDTLAVRATNSGPGSPTLLRPSQGLLPRELNDEYALGIDDPERVGTEELHEALLWASLNTPPQDGDGGQDAGDGGGQDGGTGGQDAGDGGGQDAGDGGGQDAGDGGAGGAGGQDTGGQDAGVGGEPLFRSIVGDDVPEGVTQRPHASIDSMIESTAKDIADHQRKNPGSALPESVTEWLADVALRPVLSDKELSLLMVGRELDATRSGSRRTTRRVSRREHDTPFYMPGRAQPVVDLYVGFDVSGSKTDAELVRDSSEVLALGQRRGMKVRYFSVSTMHHQMRELMPGEAPTFDRDGAGTDMRVAFDVFDIHKAKAAILFTDGYTPWPTEVPPGVHYIVAITAPDRASFDQVAADVPAGLTAVYLPPADAEEPRTPFY